MSVLHKCSRLCCETFITDKESNSQMMDATCSKSSRWQVSWFAATSGILEDCFPSSL